MPRIVFPAGTPPEVLAAWLRDAQSARYIGEIELPIVRRAPAEPPPQMDSLFDRLPIQRKGEKQRPEPPPAGTPLHVIVSSIFEGAISPPSPLALKRRERRAEREAAAKAAALKAKAAAKAARKPVPEPASGPVSLTDDEVREIEACLPFFYTYGPVGDAAKKRWEAWFSHEASQEQFTVPLKGKRDRASIYVVQTRLGWTVSYNYQYPDHGGGGGGGIAPPMDMEGMYLWRDRQAAIQYGAHCLLSGAVHPTPGQTIDARAKIGKVVKAFFDELGIDATVAPPAERRRRLISKQRIEDLRAAASEAA